MKKSYDQLRDDLTSMVGNSDLEGIIAYVQGVQNAPAPVTEVPETPKEVPILVGTDYCIPCNMYYSPEHPHQHATNPKED